MDYEEKQCEDYKQSINDRISAITNIGTLQYLDRFLELFIEKWG